MSKGLVVDATWEELGFKVRPLGDRVFVRTDPLPEKTRSGLYAPPIMASPYGQRIGRAVVMTATVLSVGRGMYDKKGRLYPTEVKPGEKVMFTRFEFAWMWKLSDGTLVGWIREPHLIGQPDVTPTFVGEVAV
jgi:co-chaperonin GroES (HSP10)